MNICVCMYMYVYMYIYVCVCVYVYIYVFMYMYVYIYITRGCWNVDCGPFIHCCPIHWRGGGGMIFFTKSLSFIVWKLLI